ncbi:MAG: DUF4019 domain-containing protein [Acidobacteria bacterium]|nr:DUF4019 domain-containing protein [Acidobacteriota bacterium]
MKDKPSSKIALLLIAAGLALSGACSLTKGKEIGERAVAQFHDQFNAGQYHEIYGQADGGFRKATAEADAVALFEGVRRKLGAVTNSVQTGWRVNATNAGTVVALQYDTEFTQGKATEQFVLMVSGESARLYNYNVNSPLLITR